MTASSHNQDIVPDPRDDVLASSRDFLPAFGAGRVVFPNMEAGKMKVDDLS
jgi:hypothetical protein